MNRKVEDLLQSALKLPDDEQLELAAALNSSLDERGLQPLDEAWLTEIQRRSDEYDAGRLKTVSWDEVKQKARREILGESGA